MNRDDLACLMAAIIYAQREKSDEEQKGAVAAALDLIDKVQEEIQDEEFYEKAQENPTL